MENVFVKVEVNNSHVGKVMFSINQSDGLRCGEIENFGDGVFICKHNPDPKDQFKTTGSVVKWVLVEIEMPTDDEILDATIVKQDKDQVQFLRGIDFFKDHIKTQSKPL